MIVGFHSFLEGATALRHYWANKDRAAAVQSYTQALALVCAGGYFLLKAQQGFFVVDMTVDLKVERTPTPEGGFDYLVAEVALKRGTQGTFRVQDAVAILRRNGKEPQVAKLGIERYQTVVVDGRYEINCKSFAKEVRRINFAPGDATTFTALWKVEPTEPCHVEVVIVGTKFFSNKRAQWRASATSLPREPLRRVVIS